MAKQRTYKDAKKKGAPPPKGPTLKFRTQTLLLDTAIPASPAEHSNDSAVHVV